MRQFDVLPNPSGRSRDVAPYIVILQSQHLAAMPTVVAAPMLRHDDRSAYTELSVIVSFQDERYIVSTGTRGARQSASPRSGRRPA